LPDKPYSAILVGGGQDGVTQVSAVDFVEAHIAADMVGKPGRQRESSAGPEQVFRCALSARVADAPRRLHAAYALPGPTDAVLDRAMTGRPMSISGSLC